MTSHQAFKKAEAEIKILDLQKERKKGGQRGSASLAPDREESHIAQEPQPSGKDDDLQKTLVGEHSGSGDGGGQEHLPGGPGAVVFPDATSGAVSSSSGWPAREEPRACHRYDCKYATGRSGGTRSKQSYSITKLQPGPRSQTHVTFGE